MDITILELLITEFYSEEVEILIMKMKELIKLKILKKL